MKGYIYIDRQFASNRKLVTEFLSSDAFRESGYEIRINATKTEMSEKWLSSAYDFDENDPLLVFVSVLKSLGYSPSEVCYDGDVDYCNLQKIKAKEGMLLNSIFFLLDDPGISRQHGVSVVKSTDNNVMKQPRNKPIKNGESISWSDLMPSDFWNSIIIADCYILKDRATIERNLFPIIDKGHCSLLNKVQITIFTQFMKDGRKLMWDGAFKLLKSRYPNASIEIIDVIDASKEVHDRSILTNHYYIHLPGGADLLDARGRSTKHTKVITYKYPQFYDVAKDDVDDFCESAKSYREKARDRIGDKTDFKNRLIF